MVVSVGSDSFAQAKSETNAHNLQSQDAGCDANDQVQVGDHDGLDCIIATLKNEKKYGVK